MLSPTTTFDNLCEMVINYDQAQKKPTSKKTSTVDFQAAEINFTEQIQQLKSKLRQLEGQNKSKRRRPGKDEGDDDGRQFVGAAGYTGCHNCGSSKHLARDCTKRSREESASSSEDKAKKKLKHSKTKKKSKMMDLHSMRRKSKPVFGCKKDIDAAYYSDSDNEHNNDASDSDSD